MFRWMRETLSSSSSNSKATYSWKMYTKRELILLWLPWFGKSLWLLQSHISPPHIRAPLKQVSAPPGRSSPAESAAACEPSDGPRTLNEHKETHRDALNSLFEAFFNAGLWGFNCSVCCCLFYFSFRINLQLECFYFQFWGQVFMESSCMPSSPAS